MLGSGGQGEQDERDGQGERDGQDGRVARRAVLRAGALGAGALGTGAAVAAAGGTAAASAAVPRAAAPATATGGLPPFRLFAQEDLNFETLIALGSAGYGTSEVGEIVTAVNAINAAGPTYQAYYDVFSATARRLGQLADRELAAGHKVSARSAYLRAATYWDVSLFFVLGTRFHAREASVFAAMQRNWAAACTLFDPPWEFVRIPYGKTWLPGYFLRPDTSTVRRPTVILNNGSDGQNVDLVAFGGAAALERGFNALILEGPGQGSVLFEREIPFRPHWEHVITPVVSYLAGRPDVDARRIGLTGWSMCGESVVRAAAFEHRLAAVVADPGVRDAWLAFPEIIRKLFRGGAPKAEVNHVWNKEIVPALTAAERYTFAKRSELFGVQYLRAARAGRVFTDLYDLGQTIMQVSCGPVVHQVTSPTLVLGYQKDMFYAGQAIAVYRLLRPGLRKEFHHFTTAEGAEFHDAPMAPQTRNQVVFDWLDTIIG
jgi:dienelactone hydrolase